MCDLCQHLENLILTEDILADELLQVLSRLLTSSEVESYHVRGPNTWVIQQTLEIGECIPKDLLWYRAVFFQVPLSDRVLLQHQTTEKYRLPLYFLGMGKFWVPRFYVVYTDDQVRQMFHKFGEMLIAVGQIYLHQFEKLEVYICHESFEVMLPYLVDQQYYNF